MTAPSYRQLDVWTTKGYVHAEGKANPGTGYRRQWSGTELAIAAEILRLKRAGLAVEVAARAAREAAQGRHVIELAPGVVLSVGGEAVRHA